MRIIAGTARGIPLAVPKTVTRPTADRTREALFSILADLVPGSRVLDLFAGSGALGLEALSRGAAHACFVDQNRNAFQTITNNAAKAGLASAATIRQSEVSQFLKTRPATPFDIVFADPPYKKRPGDPDHASRLLASPFLPAQISADGIFVLEDSSSRVLDSASDTSEPTLWELADTRTYGAARLRLFRLRNTE